MVLVITMLLWQDQRPEALLRFEEAREAIVTADVTMSKVFPLRETSNEPWYLRNIIAGDEVAFLSLGTPSGITSWRGETGEPVYKGPYTWLREGNVEWGYQAGENNCQYRINPLNKRVSDFRSAGMGYKPTTAGPEEAITELLGTSDVIYSEEMEGDIYRVEARGNDETVVWRIDPALDWNARSCELWRGDELIVYSETEYEDVGGTFIPTRVGYFNNDGDAYILVTVEDAVVNDPALPIDLVPEYIGMEVGCNVFGDGKPGTLYAGNGKTLPSKELLAAEARGEIQVGPIMLARRRGEPTSWSLPPATVVKARLLGETSNTATSQPEAGDQEQHEFHAKPAVELDEWDKYVLKFIRDYGLNDEQAQKAIQTLRSCKLQRDHFLEAQKDRMEALRKKGDKEKLDKLLAVPTRIFEERLKPGLDRLLTRKQRSSKQEAP
jgi:hypothetical protein